MSTTEPFGVARRCLQLHVWSANFVESPRWCTSIYLVGVSEASFFAGIVFAWGRHFGYVLLYRSTVLKRYLRRSTVDLPPLANEREIDSPAFFSQEPIESFKLTEHRIGFQGERVGQTGRLERVTIRSATTPTSYLHQPQIMLFALCP